MNHSLSRYFEKEKKIFYKKLQTLKINFKISLLSDRTVRVRDRKRRERERERNSVCFQKGRQRKRVWKSICLKEFLQKSISLWNTFLSQDKDGFVHPTQDNIFFS